MPRLPAGEDGASVPAAQAQFGYVRVRYCCVAKNATQVLTLFALSNLWLERRHLLAALAPSRGVDRTVLRPDERTLSSRITALG